MVPSPPPGPPAPPPALFGSAEGAAIALGAATIALLAAHLAYRTLKPSFLAALATRLTREDARSDSTRARLLELLLSEGPSGLAELARKAGISRGACRHHISVLEHHHLVYDAGVGARACYAHATMPRALARRSAALQAPEARRLHDVLLSDGALGVRAVARGASVSPSVALWHLEKLARAEVVVVREEDGRKLYAVPTSDAARQRLRLSP